MSDPLDQAPDWSEVQVDGWVTSASAIIGLGPPSATPNLPAITIYLDIEESDDESEVAEGPVENSGAQISSPYAWRFSYCNTEDEDSWSEEGDESGQTFEVEKAKQDCWRAVIQFLKADGYSDDEIADSV
jgi:hypothetical protein